MYALNRDDRTTAERVLAPDSTVAVVVVAVLAVGLGTATLASSSVFGLYVLAWVALLPATWAGRTDLRTGRLPNALVALTALPAATVVVHESITGRPEAAFPVAAGAIVFALPLLVLHLVAPASMGFGDVKLAAALGATVGIFDARLSLLALCVATGVTGGAGLVLRRRSMPLGPGLVIGAAVGLIAAPVLGVEPASWR